MKPQADLALGNHACLIWGDSAGHLAVVPHVKQSLDGGERCLYVADGPEAQAFEYALASEGVNVEDERNRGALVFMSREDYRPPGAFDVEVMAGRVQRLVQQAIDDGFAGLLLVVDMTWALHPDVSPDVLARWEAIGNDLLSGSPAKAVCIYKRAAFTPGLLRDALRTHSLVLVGGQLQPNPYYEPPDVFLDPAAESERLDWMLSQISWEQERQRRIQEEAAQKKEAEDALRARDAFYKQLMENLPIGIYTCDVDGYITSFTRRAAEMWGREPKLGDPAERFCGSLRIFDLDGNFIAHSQCPMAMTVMDGKPRVNQEIVIERPDGSKLFALVNPAPLLDDQGNMVGAVNCFIDATERHRAQEDIRNEHERLELVLETAPVGMLIVDSNGNILLANREIYRILDMSSETLRTLDDYLGAAVHLRPDGSLVPFEERPIWRALRNAERILADEIVYQLPGGRKVPALVNKTPVISAAGEVLMVILAIQDMSALEESQRARSEFLGVVSHEMRNPIAIIKGAASTVRASRGLLAPEDTWEMFEIIEEQADRLRDLVDNLLDINRIEAGMLSIMPELVDLGAVLEEAQASYQRGGGLHSIVVHVPDGDTLVNGDRSKLVQVLMNLLSNASKFSKPPQPIAIDVDTNGTHVTVSVRDEGMGIPQDKLPMLFRKFTRLHSGSTGAPAGTGLGLAICRGLVEAHGGRIWADSPGEGQGATFSFMLPVATNGKHPPAAPARTYREPLYESNGGDHRPRILVVDDEVRILDILKRSITAAGYDVTTTPDPAEAIRLVKAEKPDLLLLDIMMPGMSGLDMLEKIREFSDVPAIFITASDADENRLRAAQVKAADYITKPFSTADVVSRLESALNRRAAAG